MINPKKDTKVKRRLKEFNEKYMPFGVLMVLNQWCGKWYVELQDSRLEPMIAISNSDAHGYDIWFYNANHLAADNPCGQITHFFYHGTFILDQIKLLERESREAA